MFEKKLISTWATFSDTQKKQLTVSFIENLQKEKNERSLNDLMLFIKRYACQGYRDCTIKKLKSEKLAEHIISSISMSRDITRTNSHLSELCCYFYLSYDKQKILPNFLDLLKVPHDGSGGISGELWGSLKKRLAEVSKEEIAKSTQSLRKKFSDKSSFGLINALYTMMPEWEILEETLSTFHTQDSVNKAETAVSPNADLLIPNHEFLSTKHTHLDKLIIDSVVASVNEEPGSHNYEVLYEIIDELITMNSRPACQYHYEHMGFLDSLFEKEINYQYIEKNNSNETRKQYYLYGYFTGLFRNKEKTKDKILEVFESNKELICNLPKNAVDEKLFTLQQNLFSLLVEENHIKDAGSLLSDKTFNGQTDKNCAFVDGVMKQIKGWLLRERIDEANQLVSSLEQLPYSQKDEDLLIKARYYRARIYQLSGNFSKAIMVYDELCNLENAYKYVYITERSLCKLGYKDIRYMEFPDNEGKIKDFYNRISPEFNSFKEAVSLSPEKAVNASLALGLILLSKNFHESSDDCSLYFDRALERITTTYFEEYRLLDIDRDLLFLSTMAHSLENKARLCLAVSDAEKLDDHLVLKIKSNIEKVSQTDKGFSLALWSRFIVAVEALGENGFTSTIYDTIATGKMKNKEEVLKLFKVDSLALSEEFAKRKFQNIVTNSNNVIKIETLTQFVNEYNENHSSLCSDAIDKMEEIVFFEDCVCIECSQAMLGSLRERTNKVNLSYSEQERLELMIQILEKQPDLQLNKELEGCYDSLLELLMKDKDTHHHARDLFSQLNKDLFPEKRLRIIEKNLGINSISNFEMLLRDYNGKINMSFFGGGTRHRVAFKNAIHEFHAKYPGKLQVVDEPIFIYEGCSGNWGRVLGKCEEMISKSDKVIINNDIRTNFGRELRKMSGNKWSSCKGSGTGIFFRTIEKSCADHIMKTQQHFCKEKKIA